MKPPAADGLLLIHGEEHHLIDGDARLWLAEARRLAMSDLDVEVVDSPARLAQIRPGLTGVPFLSERRWLLVRDPPQLAERSRRGADSAEALVEALRGRNPSNAVCLVAHITVSPTHPLRVALTELAGRSIEHRRLRGRGLYEWVEAALAERRLRLPRAAVDHLVRAGEPDLGRIDGEVAKLAAYADGRPSLDVAEVRSIVAGAEQVEIWDVLDRLLTPPHGRGVAAVDRLLADGVATQQITAALAGQLRDVLVADAALTTGGGVASVAASLGVPPWRAERAARWASATSPELVEGWLRALHRLDADVKLGRADDAAGLRALLLHAARQLQQGRSLPKP